MGKKKGNNFREEKELILKDPKENENYGFVKGAKGNGRFDIETPDGTVKLGVLAGKHRKRMWINAGDIVLVGICNFQKDKFSQFTDDLEVDYFSTDLPDEVDSEESE